MLIKKNAERENQIINLKVVNLLQLHCARKMDLSFN